MDSTRARGEMVITSDYGSLVRRSNRRGPATFFKHSKISGAFFVFDVKKVRVL